MDAKKFDQLIKDQLYDHKSDVNDDSWAKLEFILDSKEDKKALYVWTYWRAVAAVFSLITLSWLGYGSFNYWHDMKQWKLSISLLKLEKIDYKRLDESSLAPPYVLSELAHANYTTTPTSRPSLREPIKKDKVLIASSLKNSGDSVSIIQPIPIKEEDKQAIAYQEQKTEPVRITYKRSKEAFVEAVVDSQDSTKTNRVVAFLNTTKGFQSRELWADVRSAKDKVLQSPFGIYKQLQRLK